MITNFTTGPCPMGYMVTKLGEALCLEFFTILILPATIWPCGHPSLLTEMSTRNISWGDKGSWCIGLTTCHLHVQTVLEILEA
jgi:hypothetical protein